MFTYDFVYDGEHKEPKHDDEECEEIAIVVGANAVCDPRTVMIINADTSFTDFTMARSVRFDYFTVVADRRSLILLEDLEVAFGGFLFELSGVAKVAEEVGNEDQNTQNQVRYSQVQLRFDMLTHNKTNIQDVVAQKQKYKYVERQSVPV